MGARMKRAPYIRLNTAALTNNFNRLTWEEQGAYVRLLGFLALSGKPLPDDDLLLRQMGGSPTDWSRVKSALIAKGKVAIVRDGLVNAGSGVQ